MCITIFLMLENIKYSFDMSLYEINCPEFI